MKRHQLLAARMESQLLRESSGSVAAACGQMLAIQPQDFMSGRYALAQRAGSDVTWQDVDGGFGSGLLVHSWTMRGTLHTCLAHDVQWLMKLTGERTLRKVAPRLRELQIDSNSIDKAVTIIGDYLELHGSAGRKTLFAELNARGIQTDNQRGIYLLMVLVQQSLICLGPIPIGATRAPKTLFCSTHGLGSITYQRIHCTKSSVVI